MRVLFLTYPRIGLNRGGLQIQIEETAKGLTELGVEVVFYDPWRDQIPEVDLCHVFGIDGAVISHVQRSIGLGKPVIVSSVLNLFQTPPFLTRLKALSSGIVPGMYSDLRRAKMMLHAARQIIALNEPERAQLSKIFSLDPDNIVTIPNGLNKQFGSVAPSLFEQRYGIKDFVLNVASVEERKNQLTLIRAMKGGPYPLVIIGKVPPGQESYMERCRQEADGNVIFAGGFAHNDPILASAYRAAKLFVLPSTSEVMPLTLYEAAVAGCRILVSQNVPIANSVIHLIPTFAPGSPTQLRDLIAREMEQPSTSDLQAAVSDMPTWRDVCERILTVYTRALTPQPAQ